LRMVAESVMREVIGQSSVRPIISNEIGGIAARVREGMQATLDQYEIGIVVTEVAIDRPTLPQAQDPARRGDPTQDPLAAFRDVENAEQEKQKAIQDARAYANRVVPEARGNAQRLIEEANGYRESLVAEANGQAERFRSIYNEYRLAPQVTRQRMYLETMERVLGSADKILLDNEGSGVVPYLPLNELKRTRQ
jgi:modulator of FtsH protease HflK